jgi:Prokaryotic RING finger family 1
MTPTTVTQETAGKTCPYCRFTLKPGEAAESCDTCHTLHHAECWEDNGGCAAPNCPNAGSSSRSPAGTADQRTQVMPVAAPPPPAAPPPGPIYGQPPPSRGRSPVWWIALAALLLAGGAAAAAVIVTRGGSKNNASSTTTVITTTVLSPPAATGGTPPAGPTSQGGGTQVDPDLAAAQQLSRIVDYSTRGRTFVLAHEYGRAISNRQATLDKLYGLTGGTAELQAAKRALIKAIRVSLRSDEAYATGGDPTVFDSDATRLKRQFVSQWNPLAELYALPTYTAGEIYAEALAGTRPLTKSPTQRRAIVTRRSASGCNRWRSSSVSTAPIVAMTTRNSKNDVWKNVVP